MGSGDFRIGSDLKVYVFRNTHGHKNRGWLEKPGERGQKGRKERGEGERKDGRQMCKTLHIRGPPETFSSKMNSAVREGYAYSIENKRDTIFKTIVLLTGKGARWQPSCITKER